MDTTCASQADRREGLAAFQALGAHQAGLGDAFHAIVQPAPLEHARFVAASAAAARLIGIDPDALEGPDWVGLVSGARLPANVTPIATVYAGHQFGVWAGRLGDGRALLLGDLPAHAPDPGKPDFGEHAPGTQRYELQLKGSGRTPFSRMGDGRAVLRSTIREFLCSEAMAALGVPTTRALSMVCADEPVQRERAEKAASVLRMAPSFIRFGHFEYFCHFDRHDELRQLADFVIAQFHPDWTGHKDRYQFLLEDCTKRTARLIAHWQCVGFVHGVMNTDNMSIIGQTIDYGPFGFLDRYDAGHIFNHSDHTGRYTYGMQPGIGHWNCAALAQALVPLIGSVDAARDAIEAYPRLFESALIERMRAKLGLVERHVDDDALIESMVAMLQKAKPDFTLFFRLLANESSTSGARARDTALDIEAADAWLARYRERLALEQRPEAERRAAMNAVNPKFVLRSHLAEVAIARAEGRLATGAPHELEGQQDFSEVRRLLSVLEHPFDDQPGNESYAAEPPEWASRLELSCSS